MEPDDAQKAAGHAKIFTAIVAAKWELPISKLAMGSPMWDRMESEACVDLTNQALVSIYNDVFQLPRELINVIRENKDDVPDEVLGAVEVLLEKMNGMLVLTDR